MITIAILFQIYQETIPVIAVMCNKGMRPRHWVNMSDIAGYDITPDSGSTLRKMLKLDIEQFMENFETISNAASKVQCSLMLIVQLSELSMLLDFFNT